MFCDNLFSDKAEVLYLHNEIAFMYMTSDSAGVLCGRQYCTV